MRLEVLATRHRGLAVTACEWRAYGLADPQRMADEVFERLVNYSDPNFTDFYAAVEEVVQHTYLRQAANESILERLTSNLSISKQGNSDDALLALSRLRHKHRLLLQLLHWDGLTVAEAAEALQMSADAFADRQATAEAKFRSRLARTRPDLATQEISRLMAGAKPGKHTRSGS